MKTWINQNEVEDIFYDFMKEINEFHGTVSDLCIYFESYCIQRKYSTNTNQFPRHRVAFGRFLSHLEYCKIFRKRATQGMTISIRLKTRGVE